MVECSGAEVGVPLEEAERSLAEAAGIGSHWWAGVGFAGSKGGAFMLLFGIVATGAEWRTSAWAIY